MAYIKKIQIKEKVSRKFVRLERIIAQFDGSDIVSVEEIGKLFKGLRITENGCWIRGLDSSIYTTVKRDDGTVVKAHRLMYEAFTGKKIPYNKLGCHTCDVKGCINPEHIYSGSQVENALDARARSIGVEIVVAEKEPLTFYGFTPRTGIEI